MRCYNWERRILGGFSILLLLGWLTICITDVNHPPGTRWIRLGAAAAVLAVGAIEFFWAWRGLLLAFLSVPHMLLFQYWAASSLSPLFSELPAFWSWPLAAALATSIFVRCEFELRAARKSKSSLDTIELGQMRFFRQALCVLLVAIGIGTITGLLNIHQHAPGWRIEKTDWRHLLLPGLFVELRPLLAAVEWVPPILLALLLLNLFENPVVRTHWRKNRNGFPARTLAAAICASFGIVALEVISQWAAGWKWPFDAAPPSGPFANRNTTAPLLAMVSVIALMLAVERWRRLLLAAVFAVCCNAVLLGGSKNGVFTLLTGVSVLAAALMGKWRWQFVGLELVCILGVLLWLPLPKPDVDATSNNVAGRFADSVRALRTGDLNLAFTFRTGCYAAAWNIIRKHPYTGAGLGTYPMLASEGAEQAGDLFDFAPGGAAIHAHCIPLQLWAEIGIVGMLGWTFAMLLAPLRLILSNPENKWMVLVLAAGVANLFDAVWFSPGAALFLTATIPLACWETFVPPDGRVQPGTPAGPPAVGSRTRGGDA